MRSFSPSYRMYELQRGGMQIQTVGRLAVEVVAYNRMVQSLRMGSMYTEPDGYVLYADRM